MLLVLVQAVLLLLGITTNSTKYECQSWGWKGFTFWTGKRRVRADARPWTLFVLLCRSLGVLCLGSSRYLSYAYGMLQNGCSTRVPPILQCEHVHSPHRADTGHGPYQYRHDPQTNRDRTRDRQGCHLVIPRCAARCYADNRPPNPFWRERCSRSTRASIATPQGKAAPVESVYRAGGRIEDSQQPGHLRFRRLLQGAPRYAKFAAAVRKAWGSSRNGGHCHFRQLKQQGWPQCAKDFSSHHGLPNWGPTSLWPRRITNCLNAWTCATGLYVHVPGALMEAHCSSIMRKGAACCW
ncbi:hypothetical protein GGI43DRAFT_101705 [Trichoderma evansii]